MNTYGDPPDPATCVVVNLPDTIITKTDQGFLTPVVNTDMVPGGLARPLTPTAIARQLRLHFKGKPVMVKVEPHGTFYVDKKGWRVE